MIFYILGAVAALGIVYALMNTIVKYEMFPEEDSFAGNFLQTKVVERAVETDISRTYYQLTNSLTDTLEGADTDITIREYVGSDEYIDTHMTAEEYANSLNDNEIASFSAIATKYYKDSVVVSDEGAKGISYTYVEPKEDGFAEYRDDTFIAISYSEVRNIMRDYYRSNETVDYSEYDGEIYIDGLSLDDDLLMLGMENAERYVYFPNRYLELDNETSFRDTVVGAIYDRHFLNYKTEVFMTTLTDAALEELAGIYYVPYPIYTTYSVYSQNGVYYDDDNEVTREYYQSITEDMDSQCDLIIRYNSSEDVLSQDGRADAGSRIFTPMEVVDRDYLNDTISSSEVPEDYEFVLGYSIYSDVNSYLFDEYILYRYFTLFDNPEVILAVSIVIFILAVIVLIIGAGVRVDDEGDRKTYTIWFDRVPIELLIFLYIMFFGFMLLMAEYMVRLDGVQNMMGVRSGGNSYPIILMIMAVFVTYILCAEFVLSFVRRIRAHILLRDLLVVRLFRWIGRMISRISRHFSGQGRLAAKILAVLLINILGIILCASIWGGEAAILSFMLIIFDIFVAYRVSVRFLYLKKLLDVSRRIESGELGAKVDTEQLVDIYQELGDSINNIGSGLESAVESSTRNERMKAELITNVSHDIKTPLTSIINYVELLKRENIESDTVRGYIDVLDSKSQRLKRLIQDLIDVSKASTGNVEVVKTRINLSELLNQVIAEESDKINAADLELIASIPDEVSVYADGRLVYRIMENLFQNVIKYSMPSTRVYLDLKADGGPAVTLKNVSREMLNISAEELTERFVRGDRSRYTEGSGLGLSIAKELTNVQGGDFNISIDGDLFSVTVTLPAYRSYVPEI